MQPCSEVQTRTTNAPPGPGSIGKRKALFSMLQVLFFWASFSPPGRNRQSGFSGIWNGSGCSDAGGWRDRGMLQGSSSRTGASPQMGILPAGLGVGWVAAARRTGPGTGQIIEAEGRASQNTPAEGARGPTKRTREEGGLCAKAWMGVWRRGRQVPGGTARRSFPGIGGRGARGGG